jgi:hypothetical protein
MRTKLLAAAAILAAGLATSMAQSNVYSLNVVGYVNVPLSTGFNLIANPLNNTNNSLSTLIPNAGFGDTVYTYNPSAGTFTSSLYLGSWSPDLVINPGEGFWYGANAAMTNTFVGEVMQGSLTNPIPAGFSIKASQVPQADTLGNLNFPAGFGDTAYFYRNGAYVSSLYLGSWSPDLTVGVGEGFWIGANAAANWVRNFTVTP